MMPRAAPIALLLAALACPACTNRPPARPAVTGAWIRLPAVPGRPGAGYFTIAGGAAPVRLVALTSPAIARIELHESMAGMAGMATMRPIAAVAVPADGIAFAPGGRHAMLFGLSPAVARGGTVPLAFRLADGRRIVTQARVVAAGDPAP